MARHPAQFAAVLVAAVASAEGYTIDPALKYSLDEQVVCGELELRHTKDFQTKRLAELKGHAKGESWASNVRYRPTIEKESRELVATERDLGSCIEQLQKRKEERLAATESRTLEQLRAIPENERLPEEGRRLLAMEAVEAQERRAWAERVRTRQSDPKWMAPVFSAQICNLKESRAAAITEIATEKRYAKQLGGVIDAEKLYSLQAQVRGADEELARLQANARALKAKILQCSVRLVAIVANCERNYQSGETAPEACDEEQVREHVELIGPVTDD